MNSNDAPATKNDRAQQPWTRPLFAMLGAGLVIAALHWLETLLHATVLIAPFAASCALAFGAPDSPLAQPRSIVGGHVVSAAAGLAVFAVFGVGAWQIALAVALAVGTMMATRTLHAPAAANPVVAAASAASWSFLLTPVLLGAGVVVLGALAVNNIRRPGSYPSAWF